MKTDGRFIEHVKNTAQIRAKLSGQTNPLRFATAQRLGRATEREITEAYVAHETQPLLHLRQQLGCDRLLRSAKAQFRQQPGRLLRR